MTTAWKRARRILAVRLDSMGDVLMTTPAIRALGSRGASVTLLTSPAGAAVARLVPEIDEVNVHEAPWMKATSAADPASDLAVIETLRERRFDAAAIFTVYSQNPLPAAMLCHLSGIPRVAAHCREKVYALLSDQLPETEPEGGIRHEVRRQLDLVATLGLTPLEEHLSILPPLDAAPRVAAKLRAGKLDEFAPWLVLHPGASAPSRRYPTALFAKTVSVLHRRGWRTVLIGSGEDVPLTREIEVLSGVRCLSLAGDLDLGELAALIAGAPMLLANNSGPMHIAAATGTPVVCLYALTNVQHTPWQVPARILSHDVACRLCYRSQCPEGHNACLTGITPGRVVDAVLSLAAETGVQRQAA